MTQQPTPIRKCSGVADTEPPKPQTTPVMQVGYWLFLLLALIVTGEFILVCMGVLVGNEARDLFLVMGMPVLVLFGLVIGVVLSGKRP